VPPAPAGPRDAPAPHAYFTIAALILSGARLEVRAGARQGARGLQGDSFLRSAVERQLIILGEAVVQLSKLTPELADRIPERGSIIAFRIIHGYAAVVDEIVWEVLEDDLPALWASAARLIEELPPGT
jgi:uncharacterized protein with HEPN domain